MSTQQNNSSTQYDPTFFERFGIKTSITYVTDLIVEDGLEENFEKRWKKFYKKNKSDVLNWRERKFNSILDKIHKKGTDEDYCKKVEIRFIDEEIGYGVFAKEDISAGAVLNHYAGIVRLDNKIEEGNDSTFTFDEFSKYSIDSVRSGNWTRFMNHTCEKGANIAAWEHYTEKGPRIFFTVKSKGVKKGKQLLYSYGESYWDEDEDCEFDL